MKMTKEHFEFLREKVEPWDTPAHRQMYIKRDFPRAKNVKDVDRRYRWDLFIASMRGEERVNFYGQAYKYLNDDHIDTALRRIVAPLNQATS